ncbi:hypothetical protein ACFCXH_01770 [Streptomyces nojiriensis]|uniref:hypothetical protein n=1 Tax=Streptomyces nojiriensis TaxID=66374 RepID=UPI0035DBA8FB
MSQTPQPSGIRTMISACGIERRVHPVPADLAHLQKPYREINGAELPGGPPDTV